MIRINCYGNLGFVLIAVQESAFLPPPTQFDILYGFTDLPIIMVMIMTIMVMVVRMVMLVIVWLWWLWWWSWGWWLRWWFCTCNRQVQYSSLCISPFGIFCWPVDHQDYGKYFDIDDLDDINFCRGDIAFFEEKTHRWCWCWPAVVFDYDPSCAVLINSKY